MRMKNSEYEADQELEEEGGDANDGQHEEVGDQEGASSILKIMMMVMMMRRRRMMIERWIDRLYGLHLITEVGEPPHIAKSDGVAKS